MVHSTNYSVYRSADLGDCSNHGLTSRLDSVTTFYDCSRVEAIEYCETHDINPNECLFIVKRYIWGSDSSYAEPLIMPKGHNMFGGNFIYTCNGCSFHFDGEDVTRPIQVHDRFESRDEYKAFSI